MKIFSLIWSWLTRRWRRDWRTTWVEGDELPGDLPRDTLTVARDGTELWAAGMQCPCGCGRRLELMLLEDVKPRWDLTIDDRNRPTLAPSVWVADGCRSHFWLRAGRIHWC